MALVYCCSLDGLIASIVLLICTSLWIKASAKWLNVNVNVNILVFLSATLWQRVNLHIQLYISSRPGETHQIEKLMECIVDIKNWMTSNFLLLNSEKTEVLIIGPKTPTSINLEHCLTLDGCSVNSSSSVRNLGVLFDSNLSFDSHVSSICKTAFFSS